MTINELEVISTSRPTPAMATGSPAQGHGTSAIITSNHAP